MTEPTWREELRWAKADMFNRIDDRFDRAIAGMTLPRERSWIDSLPAFDPDTAEDGVTYLVPVQVILDNDDTIDASVGEGDRWELNQHIMWGGDSWRQEHAELADIPPRPAETPYNAPFDAPNPASEWRNKYRERITEYTDRLWQESIKGTTLLERVFKSKREDDHYDDVVESLWEYGFARPIMIGPSRDGGWQLGDGNHRMAAAVDLGFTHVPAMWSEDLWDTVARDSGDWNRSLPVHDFDGSIVLPPQTEYDYYY